LSARWPQASGVTQTPPGQAAPLGHSDFTARHSQPAAAAQLATVACPPQASFTTAAGTGRSLAWV